MNPQKTLTTFLFLLSGIQFVFGQTFGNYFINSDSLLNDGAGYSNYNNFYGDLAWGESRILMSYMVMYKATENVGFLKKLITHSKNVIQQRDDNQNRVDYRGVSGTTWIAADPEYTMDGEPYAFIVHSGMITYPMVDFAQLVISTPGLHNKISNEGETFLDIANWIVEEVALTIDAHEDQWDSNNDIYRYRNTDILYNPDEILPYNQYAAFGRTLIKAYLASNNPAYLQKVIGLATHFKNALTLDNTTDTYSWPNDPWTTSTNLEDLGHGYIDVDFAYLCFNNGIVFDSIDMIRFANTFEKKIYLNPLAFSNNVLGGGGVNRYILQVGLWLTLSVFNKDIYHPIADVYIDRALDIVNPETAGYLLFAIANCALFQENLNPIGTYRNTGPDSDWAGITIGNFDNDNEHEILSVRNFDGRFYLFDYEDNQFVYLAETDSLSTAENWAGIAAGDFDNDGVDEFVAVKNSDSQFYMFEYSNGEIALITSTSFVGNNSNWAGIAAGDFDNDGVDEFVAVRNSDSQFHMFEYSDGSISGIASTNFVGANSNWVGVAAGDIDNDGIDEFVAVRNSDSQFHIFEYSDSSISGIASTNFIGANSDWKAIAAGDFNDDGVDEFVGSRNVDGDLFFLKYDTSLDQILLIEREFFPENYRISSLCAGRLGSVNGNGDDIIFIRGYDANFLAYSINLESFLPTGIDHPFYLSQNLINKYYPNPSHSSLTLELNFNSINRDEYDFYVIDNAGLVKGGLRSKFKPMGDNLVQLNVENFPSGIYYILISSKDNWQTIKFLKL